MDRRTLLHWLSGSAALAFLPHGQELLEAGRALHQAPAPGPGRKLEPALREFLSLLGERILPRTDSPGATDVDAAGFVERLLADWYPDDERARFLAGLDAIADRARSAHGRPLAELDEPAQVAFLTALDGESGALETAPGAFARVKGLVIYAYVTAEVVRNEVLHTHIIPGRFDGCIPWVRP